MPLIQYDAPWDSQPQEAVELLPQYQHGLALFHMPDAELAHNAFLSTNIPGTIVGPSGRAYSTSGAGGRASTNARLTTSDGAGTGDFTIIVHAAPTSSTTRQMPIAVANSGGSGGESYLIFNANSGLAPSAGNWTFTSFPTSTGLNTSGVDGAVHSFGVRRRGSLLELFYDGALVASSTYTGALNPSSGAFDCIAGYSGSGYGHVDPLYQVGGWNRAFTDAEMLEARDQNWAFAPRVIRVPVAAAGGATLPTLSNATFVPGSVTATSFRPRVTATY